MSELDIFGIRICPASTADDDGGKVGAPQTLGSVTKSSIHAVTLVRRRASWCRGRGYMTRLKTVVDVPPPPAEVTYFSSSAVTVIRRFESVPD